MMFPEGRPFDINASLAITPGQNCSYIHPFHPTSTTEVRTNHTLMCVAARGSRFGVSTLSAGQPPQSSPLLMSHQCAWVRRKTQGQPSTKGISQKKNPSHVERASTRRETQYQAARTPLREEFKVCNRCRTSRDPLNNYHDTDEVIFDALIVVLTRRLVLEAQILVSWGKWGRSIGASP